MADASCCTCTPRLLSIETQGLQVGRLCMAALVGNGSYCINDIWGAAASYALTVSSHAAIAIPAPHCTNTSVPHCT